MILLRKSSNITAHSVFMHKANASMMKFERNGIYWNYMDSRGTGTVRKEYEATHR
jgi:hypothetical protein